MESSVVVCSVEIGQIFFTWDVTRTTKPCGSLGSIIVSKRQRSSVVQMKRDPEPANCVSICQYIQYSCV